MLKLERHSFEIINSLWKPSLSMLLFLVSLCDTRSKDLFDLQLAAGNAVTFDKRYQYPMKKEVTASVGYGNYLHPFYYQGVKKKMYPCAVECEEWSSMENMYEEPDESGSEQAASIITPRPDISSIKITTVTPIRSYKDVSSFRSKINESDSAASNRVPQFDKDSHDLIKLIQESSKLYPNNEEPSLDEEENLPQKESIDDFSDDPWFGKLYNLDKEIAELENDEYFDSADLVDPIDTSLSYNPPEFDDTPHNRKSKYPGRVKGNYVRHKIREEHLEGSKTDFLPKTNNFIRNEPYEKDSQKQNNFPTALQGFVPSQPFPDPSIKDDNGPHHQTYKELDVITNHKNPIRPTSSLQNLPLHQRHNTYNQQQMNSVNYSPWTGNRVRPSGNRYRNSGRPKTIGFSRLVNSAVEKPVVCSSLQNVPGRRPQYGNIPNKCLHTNTGRPIRIFKSLSHHDKPFSFNYQAHRWLPNGGGLPRGQRFLGKPRKRVQDQPRKIYIIKKW